MSVSATIAPMSKKQTNGEKPTHKDLIPAKFGISLRLPGLMVYAIEQYIRTFELKPDRTTLVIAAIKEYLEKRDAWPLDDDHEYDESIIDETFGK